MLVRSSEEKNQSLLVRVKEAADARAAAAERAARDASAAGAEREAAAREREAATAVIGFQEMMQELREEIASLRKERDVHEARMRAQGMDKCFECQGSGMCEYGICGHCDGDGWVPC